MLLFYDHKAMEAMLRDRAEWGGQPFYLGAISQIGILTWGAGAAVALFTAAFAQARERQPEHQQERLRLLRWVGLFTLVLCIDDAFQLHEVVAPRYLYIDQKAILGLYALTTLGIVVAFRRLLIERPVLPMAAVAALATSVAIDLSEHLWTVRTVQILVEDGFKQLGILLWVAFLIRQSSAAFAERTTTAPAAIRERASIRPRRSLPARAASLYRTALPSTGQRPPEVF